MGVATGLYNIVQWCNEKFNPFIEISAINSKMCVILVCYRLVTVYDTLMAYIGVYFTVSLITAKIDLVIQYLRYILFFWLNYIKNNVTTFT